MASTVTHTYSEYVRILKNVDNTTPKEDAKPSKPWANKGKKDHKSTKGRGARADEVSSTSKTSDNPAQGKKCHYCQKMNHFASERRKKKADMKAKKAQAEEKEDEME